MFQFDFIFLLVPFDLAEVIGVTEAFCSDVSFVLILLRVYMILSTFVLGSDHPYEDVGVGAIQKRTISRSVWWSF